MPKPNAPSIAGAVPVLVTPFEDTGAIDLESLRRQIDFCIASGAQALAFGMGSESQMLTDSEREKVWRTAVEHTGRRMPVIAAPAHPSREGILALSQLAVDCGADCIMVNPESRRGEALTSLFRDLSDQVDISIMIQDAQGNAPVETLLQAVAEASRVVSLKIESPGAPNKIGELIAEMKSAGERPIAVLGGYDGAALPEELERGSVGTMPHPAFIDAFRAVCDLHAAGKVQEAEEQYYRQILPLIRLTSAGGGIGGGIWLHKEVMHRAGILRFARCRIETRPQPEWVMEKIRLHLKRMELKIASRFG